MISRVLIRSNDVGIVNNDNCDVNVAVMNDMLYVPRTDEIASLGRFPNIDTNQVRLGNR